MSNTLYNITRQAAATASFNWPSPSNPWAVLLVDTTQYDVDVASDEHVSDIPSGAILARSNLANPTATGGACSADPLTIDSVTGDVGAVVIYENTSTDSTSQLVAYIDTAAGIPATFSDGEASLVWDTSSGNGIFRI